MPVLEFFFLLASLKLSLAHAYFAACLFLGCYYILIFNQRSASYWVMLLVMLVAFIHAHFLQSVRQGCWSFDAQFWRALSHHFQISVPRLSPGHYSSCELMSFSRQIDFSDVASSWLEAHGIHPMLGYFLFARANNDDFEKSLLTQLGLVHVLSVSGLHIDVICRVLSPFAKARYLLLLITGVLLVYGHMVSYGLPVQRALFMGIMGIWGRFYGLRLSAGFRWQLAFLMVLILNPMALEMSSFYLSFFLSAAISFVPRRLFYQALSVSVMAVSLWFFGYYPLVAILVNTLALPVYEILLVVTLLVGYVAYALDTALPLQVISQVLYRMDQLLSPFSGMMWLIANSLFVKLIFLLGSLIYACMHRMGIMVIIFFSYLLYYFWPGSIPVGEFRVKFYDVGHGLMVFIQTSAHAWIYDVPSVHAIKQYLEPDIHQQGFYLRGGLIISHSDQDHSGGLSYLMSHYLNLTRYGNLSVSGKHMQCLAGGRWMQDGVWFEWLTLADLKQKGNAASCVLMVESQSGFRLLLTGDITSEWGLYYQPNTVSLASSPHHGRNPDWFLGRLEGHSLLISDRRSKESMD